MKKILFYLLIVMTSVKTFAYDAEIDGLWYNLNSAKKTAEVTYKDYYNKCYNNNWSYLNVTIPETVIYDNNTYTVIGIGDNAFNSCFILKSVQLPSTITTIGNSAFENCWELGDISIPEGVVRIGNAAFKNCNKFTSLVIPNSVATIGKSVCYGCDHLASVQIGEGVSLIDEYSFALCNCLTSLTIPNTIKSIEYYALWYCGKLKSIKIPNSIEYISTTAFAECNNLITVEINSNFVLKEVVTDIFGAQVSTYIIGGDVTEIGENAFQGSHALSTITIPKNVLTIGHGALSSCSNLREISVDTENPSYSSLDGVLFNKEQTSLVQYPMGKENTSYSFPNSVSRILGGAFKECTNISSIAFNDGLVEIEEEAFYRCGELISILIPNSVTAIGSAAFYKCSNLESITIGTGIINIASFAFSDLPRLTSMTCKASNPPTLQEDVFYKVNQASCPLYVPSESVQHYKAANQWKEFSPVIGEEFGIEDIYFNSDKPVKVLHDGHIYILRGEKVYDMEGKMVK